MPRDASVTRLRLLDEAERLFATRGIHQPTVKEIVDAAGQRNASALSYHFGSRDGVLWAILQRHGDPLDEARLPLLLEPIENMDTRALVASLLVPLARLLHEASGRNYLRIVAQLTDRFEAWRVPEHNPPNMRRVLGALEQRAHGAGAPVQRQRIVHSIMLMTAAMAERARAIDERTALDLDEAAFVSNLADMIVGGIEAPSGAPIAWPSSHGLS